VFIFLQVNEDKTKIRRINPLTEPVNVDERTVYVVRELLVCLVCNYKIVQILMFCVIMTIVKNTIHCECR